MQLTKLEICGFKSFAKKTELVFEQGVTGILGPNGCGKSNISDAFRFVLGEQNARSLRGKKMEDFIFGGTEKRRPLSFCEVSMYFDNSDGGLLSPYTEVVVSRRAYRSGESEYYINKAPCRLKDIHELFRDTGIGKDGYSIIGQGRVSEILSDRSNDRREVFEEAAGVMKYRARKEESEKKLANTTKNLQRLDDIVRELELRLEPLREQSEKAIAYFNLREELRDVEVNLFLHQHDKSSERIKQLAENIQQLDGNIEQLATEEAEHAESCTRHETIERELSAAISEISQVLVSSSTEVESDCGSIKLTEERLNSLNSDINRLTAEIESLDSAEKENVLSIARLNELLQTAEEANSELEARLEATNKEISELGSVITDKENLLNAGKQSMMDAMNNLADAKSRISRLETMKASLQQRLSAIGNESATYHDEAKHLSDELLEAENAINSIREEQSAVNLNRSEQINIANAINTNIYDAGKTQRATEDELNAIRSRIKVLTEMKRAHEGYYASVRKLLNDALRNPQLGRRINGVVAELISVPAQYESAIEMALGAALQNIVVPNEQDSKEIINYLREHDYGRATLLPISAMRPRLLTQDELRLTETDGCFGVASNLIGFDPKYRSVMENLLGRTVIVRDIDVGIEISKRTRSAFRIATLKGDILNPGGSMTGGSMQKREFSLIGREREIEELSSKEKGLQERIIGTKQTIQKLNSDLVDINERIASMSDRLRKLDVQAASHIEKVDIIKRYIDKNAEQLKKLEAESAQIEDSIADIDAECVEASEAENSINIVNAITVDDIKLLSDELTELRAELQRANERSAGVQVQLMAAAKERTATNAEIQRIKRDTAAICANKAAKTDELHTTNHNIDELRAKLLILNSKLSEDRAHLESMNDELRRLDNERAQSLNTLDELRVKRESAAMQINDMRERKHRAELNLNRLQIDLDNLCDRIWKDYELTYDNAQCYRRAIAVAQTHIRADELRKAIKALGEVNTSSIEDYRSVKDRYDNLSEQCSDLRLAQNDLNELIDRLTATMEAEFKEQFAHIQRNFSKTFAELFRGGRAELVLSDKNDVLNCNIDIIAQPPGKKLQLLTLLSGGEQALTAIALLFAILELKPAAFCILDEIDTSLDEANVDNFADYLREYSKGTQFIVITHRKGAMAVCNSLYGVSMEEKGVSSIVSAKFSA